MKKNNKERLIVKKGMVVNPSFIGVTTNILLYVIVAFLALICLLPLWHTIMCSFSDPKTLFMTEGFLFWPVGTPTTAGYEVVFSNQGIVQGYLNTIYYSAATTAIGLVLNVLGGYCLYKKSKLRTAMMLYLMGLMFFGGGMIASYIIMKEIGLVGTEWAIILPNATMGMFVIIGMNAFYTVPSATVESAEIDGANHFKIMFQIMLPQCMPLFTVTILNTFIGMWNNWLSAQIYVPYDKSKWPIQLWIQEWVNQTSDWLKVTSGNVDWTKYLIQYCVIVIAVVPIIIMFPFFQKQLEAGTLSGGVKE